MVHLRSNICIPEGLRVLLGNAYYTALGAWRRFCAENTPRRIRQKLFGYYWRSRVDRLLAKRLAKSGRSLVEGQVLYDGTWDNANYWLRSSLLWSALQLDRRQVVGVIGRNNARRCTRTLKSLGVLEIIDANAFFLEREDACKQAEELISQTTSAGDILKWRLPYGFPSAMFYDTLLKRQCNAVVDIHDRRFLDQVIDGLLSLHAADHIVRSHPFKLAIISHNINFFHGAMAWRAAQLNIPVIVPHGDFGLNRHRRLNKPTDVFESVGRPSPEEFASLTPERAELLAYVGQKYLDARKQGKTGDISGIYAFRDRAHHPVRNEICAHFGMDPNRPLIVVYAANWFDWPHHCGMSNFRDFIDWLELTFCVSQERQDFNWLFKPHPTDSWYGPVTMGDPFEILKGPNIGIVPNNWNSAAVQLACDGLVTVHGTAGVEAAALETPVLVADRGWYHDLGLALWAKSRDEYASLLKSEWWKAIDVRSAKRNAQILAGWFFGCPNWHQELIIDDDSLQERLYPGIERMVHLGAREIDREVEELRAWFLSGTQSFHTFKMVRATGFDVPLERGT